MNSLFYTPSGNTTLKGQFINYTVCVLVALFLGYFYSLMISVIPIIYINFFITIGFGLLLGFTVMFMTRLTHNRSKRSKLITAIVTGFLGVYFQWSAYIFIVLNESTPSPIDFINNLYWVAKPEYISYLISDIYKHGLWSIGAIQFRGSILGIIWLVEALIIIAIPLKIVLADKIPPYSEKLNKWFPKYTIFKDFEYIVLANNLIDQLKDNVLDTISKLELGNGNRHSKISVYFNENDNEQYLEIENVLIQNAGRGSKKKNIVVNYLKIDTITAKEILEKNRNSRERLNF